MSSAGDFRGLWQPDRMDMALAQSEGKPMVVPGYCQCCGNWLMALRYDLRGDTTRCPDCWDKIIVDKPHDDCVPDGEGTGAA